MRAEGDVVFFDKVKRFFVGNPYLSEYEVGDKAKESNLIRIEFDMMVKGSVYDRPSGRIRQCGVTVDGATRLVTSGDLVNRETLKALIQAGAVRPAAKKPKPDQAVPHEKAS